MLVYISGTPNIIQLFPLTMALALPGIDYEICETASQRSPKTMNILTFPLHGINISHLGKRKNHLHKCLENRDMLVLWRVHLLKYMNNSCNFRVICRKRRMHQRYFGSISSHRTLPLGFYLGFWMRLETCMFHVTMLGKGSTNMYVNLDLLKCKVVEKMTKYSPNGGLMVIYHGNK